MIITEAKDKYGTIIKVGDSVVAPCGGYRGRKAVIKGNVIDITLAKQSKRYRVEVQVTSTYEDYNSKIVTHSTLYKRYADEVIFLPNTNALEQEIKKLKEQFASIQELEASVQQILKYKLVNTNTV